MPKLQVGSVNLDSHAADLNSLADADGDINKRIKQYQEDTNKWFDKNSQSYAVLKGAIETASNDTLYQLEKNLLGYKGAMTYYNVYPYDPHDGDIVWHYDNSVNYSNSWVEKYINSSWNRVPTQQEFYSAQIHGGKITGAEIEGVTLHSRTQVGGWGGRYAFNVNPQGEVYAQNLMVDIDITGHDPGYRRRNYDNGTINYGRGFHLTNGIIGMEANVYQEDATANGMYNYDARTYLEPDQMKLRAFGLDGQAVARTDLASGRIEVANYNNGTQGIWWTDSGTVITPNWLKVGQYNWEYGVGLIQSLSANHKDISTGNLTATRNVDLQRGLSVGSSGISTTGDFVLAGMIRSSYGQLQIGSGITTPYWIHAAGFDKTSDLSVKRGLRNINQNKIFNQVLATDVMEYSYENSNRRYFSPIIDNVNETNKYYTPDEITNKTSKEDTLSVDNYVAYLHVAIKELAKLNQEQVFRIAKLERNIKNG